MTQADALKYLEKIKVWATCKQVSKVLKISSSTGSVSLRKLAERGEIRRKNKTPTWMKEYVYKAK